MRNIRTAVVFWIVVGISMLGFAGCGISANIANSNIIVACIESGGTWVNGDYTKKSNTSYFHEGDRCEPAP